MGSLAIGLAGNGQLLGAGAGTGLSNGLVQQYPGILVADAQSVTDAVIANGGSTVTRLSGATWPGAVAGQAFSMANAIAGTPPATLSTTIQSVSADGLTLTLASPSTAASAATAITDAGLTLNSTTVTTAQSTLGMVNEPITGPGIPRGTTVQAVSVGTNLTLSQPAYATLASQTVNVQCGVSYGTDNGPAIGAALAALLAVPMPFVKYILPPGKLLIATSIQYGLNNIDHTGQTLIVEGMGIDNTVLLMAGITNLFKQPATGHGKVPRLIRRWFTGDGNAITEGGCNAINGNASFNNDQAYPYQDPNGASIPSSNTLTTTTVPGTAPATLVDTVNAPFGAADSLVDCLCIVDENLANPATGQQAGFMIITGNSADGKTITGTQWIGVVTGQPYTPVGVGGTYTYRVQTVNFKGLHHIDEQVKWTRPVGFSHFPSKVKSINCVHDTMGSPSYGGFHQDCYGGGGVNSEIHQGTWRNSAGTFGDFAGTKAGLFPRMKAIGIADTGRRSGGAFICNGVQSIYMGVQADVLSGTQNFGAYDGTTVNANQGRNVVGLNTVGNAHVLGGSGGSGFTMDVVRGNIAGDAPFGPWTSSPPAVPATATPIGFSRAMDLHIYITAGASTCQVNTGIVNGTGVIPNGTNEMTIPSGGAAMVFVPAGGTIMLTYTSAPTWKIVGVG